TSTSPATPVPAARPRRTAGPWTSCGSPGDGGARAGGRGDAPGLGADEGPPSPPGVGGRVRRPGQPSPAARGLPARRLVRRRPRRRGGGRRRFPAPPQPRLGRPALHRRPRDAGVTPRPGPRPPAAGVGGGRGPAARLPPGPPRLGPLP